MKHSSVLKNDFPFPRKSLFALILFLVLFACHKDNSSRSGNSIEFFNYSGKDALVIKTIGQLKVLNDKAHFADSLNLLGSFKWDAYLKSVEIDTSASNYKIMIPYVDKQSVLAGYIDISVTKTGITNKPVAYNYEKDFLSTHNLLKRYLMGNSLHFFEQKNITLPENFTGFSFS